MKLYVRLFGSTALRLTPYPGAGATPLRGGGCTRRGVRLVLVLRDPVEDDTRPPRFRRIESRRHHTVHRVVAEMARFAHPREHEVLDVGRPRGEHPGRRHLPVRSTTRRAEAAHRAIDNGVRAPIHDGRASLG